MSFKFVILFATLAIAYGQYVNTIGTCQNNYIALSKQLEAKDAEPGIRQEATVQYSNPDTVSRVPAFNSYLVNEAL